MAYKNLITKKEEGLGWIIINRPDRLNALKPNSSAKPALRMIAKKGRRLS